MTAPLPLNLVVDPDSRGDTATNICSVLRLLAEADGAELEHARWLLLRMIEDGVLWLAQP